MFIKPAVITDYAKDAISKMETHRYWNNLKPMNSAYRISMTIALYIFLTLAYVFGNVRGMIDRYIFKK